MKKKILAVITASILAANAMPLCTGVSAAVTAENYQALAEETKFEAENFFVAVGTYGGESTQLRYFAQKSEGGYQVDKVVWEDAPADISYGDVFIADGEASMTKVMAAPDNPVYAMAYYYQLDEDAKLNKAGNCADLMEQKELTVKSKTYDGSAHWSIRYKDADDKEYYYGLSTFASTLTVDPLDCEVGDVYTYALYNDYMVVPLAKKDAESDVDKMPEYRIVKLPDKVEYKLGEAISIEGLQIEVKQGDKEPVVYSYPDVAFAHDSTTPKPAKVLLMSDFRSDKAGTYKVEVVGADNVSFEVRVVDEGTPVTGKEALFPKLVRYSKTLTLSEVKELAKKGSNLDWSDFEDYGFGKIDSKLYTLVFEVEGGYTLYVGNDPDKEPYYALLTRNDEEGIDIRESDAEAFMNETSEGTFKGSTIEEVFDVIKYPKKTVYTAGDELDLSGIAVECHSETFWHSENNDKKFVLYGETYTVDNITLDPKDAWVYDDSGINTRAVKGDMFNTLKSGTYQVAYGESYKYGDKEIKFCDFMYEVSIKDDTDKKTNTETFTVLDINENIIMLKPVEESTLRSAGRFAMTTKELGSDITPTVGMKLDITYWAVLESYPAQFGRIDKVAVVQDENGFVKGDANCDEQVDMADAVLIMQALANPNKYGENGTALNFNYLTALGKINADMDGDGLTVGDALAIQRKLLGLDMVDVQKIESYLTANSGFLYELGSYTIFFNSGGEYFCRRGDSSADKADNGTWTVSGDKVVLTGRFGTNRFRYEDNTLIYMADDSDGFSDVKPKDGAKFHAVFDSSDNTGTQSKLGDIVTIKTGYDPAMSDWSGIGILLEIDSPDYPVTLKAADGHFTTWDIKTGSGPIKTVGKEYNAGKSGYIFWTPDEFGYSDGFESEIQVIGVSGDVFIDLGRIYVTQVDGMKFAASFEKPDSTYRALIGKTYVYEKSGSFTITFDEHGKFACYEKDILSYMTEGTWELSGDTVKLVYSFDESTEKAVYLKVEGSDLVYIGEKSDNFTDVKVRDGEKFTDTKIRSKVDWYSGSKYIKQDIDWSAKNNNLSAVIKDTDGLKSYLENICQEETMSAYLEKYDDSFFKENVLLMRAVFQRSGSAGPIHMVNVVLSSSGKIGAFLMYNGVPEGDDMVSYSLVQITVPKEIFDNYNDVEWVGYNVLI